MAGKRNYIGIAKIGYNQQTKQPICVKYRFNNKEKFIDFLRNKFTFVYWVNVYAKDIDEGKYKGKLLYLWGNKQGFKTAN